MCVRCTAAATATEHAGNEHFFTHFEHCQWHCLLSDVHHHSSCARLVALRVLFCAAVGAALGSAVLVFVVVLVVAVVVVRTRISLPETLTDWLHCAVLTPIIIIIILVIGGGLFGCLVSSSHHSTSTTVPQTQTSFSHLLHSAQHTPSIHSTILSGLYLLYLIAIHSLPAEDHLCMCKLLLLLLLLSSNC